MFKKLIRKIRKSKVLSLSLVATGLLMLVLPATVMAFGPPRTVYDFTNPAERPGTDTPNFNSYINTNYGDERNFLRIAEAPAGDTNPVDNDYRENLTGEAGKEYWVRAYVHNIAKPSKNCDPSHVDVNGICTQIDAGSPGIATGTAVKLMYDAGSANGHDLQVHITANNATEVWDEAQLLNNNYQFKVEYVPGSTRVLTAKQNTTLQNPGTDSINTAGGMALGQDFAGNINASGSYPGCFEFESRVYVKVLVKAPVIKVTKQAFQSGTQNQLDSKTVAPDTKITWKVRYFNIGNDVANNITIRDTLPTNVTFVPGTLKWYTLHQNGVVQNANSEDVFFKQGGLNLGNYAPLTSAELAGDYDSGLLTFQTTINTNPNICTLVNNVFARATGFGEVTTNSTVNVNSASCKPPTPPVVTTPVVAPKPVTLVKTGPGDLVALFSATSVGAGAGHHVFQKRRFRG